MSSMSFRNGRRESEPGIMRPKSMQCLSRRDSLPNSNFKIQDFIRQDQEKSKLVEMMSADLGVSRSAERNLTIELQALKDSETTMRSNVEIMTERISTQKEIIDKYQNIWSNLPGTVRNLKILFNETKRMRLDRDMSEAKEENLSEIIADLAENNYRRLEEMAFIKLSMTGKMVDEEKSSLGEIHVLKSRIQELLLIERAKNVRIDQLEKFLVTVTESLQEQLKSVRELREGKQVLVETVLSLTRRIEHSGSNEITASHNITETARSNSPTNSNESTGLEEVMPSGTASPTGTPACPQSEDISSPTRRTGRRMRDLPELSYLPLQNGGDTLPMDLPRVRAEIEVEGKKQEKEPSPLKSSGDRTDTESSNRDINLFSQISLKGVEEFPIILKSESNISGCSVAVTDDLYPGHSSADIDHGTISKEDTAPRVGGSETDTFGNFDDVLKSFRESHDGQTDDICSLTSTSSLTTETVNTFSFADIIWS